MSTVSMFPVRVRTKYEMQTCKHYLFSTHVYVTELGCQTFLSLLTCVLGGTITMATRINATPVAAVPIIPTALARNLSGPLRLSEVQGAPKCG